MKISAVTQNDENQYMGKFLILYFEKSEENILRDILSGIQKRTEDYQIRNCVLDNDILYYGDLVINPIYRTLEKSGKDVHLTAHEFDILYLLAKRPGWVYSRERIYNLIWSEPYNFNERSIIHTISHLRRKIGDDAMNPHYIITVRGNGYKFNSIFRNLTGK